MIWFLLTADTGGNSAPAVLTSIASTELVMRVKQLVYHINCFACVECNERFSPGEHYALVGASVYCRAHYQQLLSATVGGPSARSQGSSVAVLSPDESPSSSSLQQSLQLEAKTRYYNSTSLKQDSRVPVTSSTYYNAVSMATTMGSGGGNKGVRSSRKRKSPPLEGGSSSDMLNGYCGPTSSLGMTNGVWEFSNELLNDSYEVGVRLPVWRQSPKITWRHSFILLLPTIIVTAISSL